MENGCGRWLDTLFDTVTGSLPDLPEPPRDALSEVS
jgi:hypothetical protein